MTLTKIASFLTSPVDVVTKTPNDFIRNPSIPTAAKVTAVALSAILLIATFSITYFIGKALLSKAQVQAPPVARPLSPSITPAPVASQAPSPEPANVVVMTAGANDPASMPKVPQAPIPAQANPDKIAYDKEKSDAYVKWALNIQIPSARLKHHNVVNHESLKSYLSSYIDDALSKLETLSFENQDLLKGALYDLQRDYKTDNLTYFNIFNIYEVLFLIDLIFDGKTPIEKREEIRRLIITT